MIRLRCRSRSLPGHCWPKPPPRHAGTLWRHAAALIAAGRQARCLPGTRGVVVTDQKAADAYALRWVPCRIVITTRMLRVLSQPERQVLLAHERSHACGLHYLFASATRLAAAANPLLRPGCRTCGYTAERWADERAAALTGDRGNWPLAPSPPRLGHHGRAIPPRRPRRQRAGYRQHLGPHAPGRAGAVAVR